MSAPSRADGGNWRSRVVGHSLGAAASRVLDDGGALVAATSRLIMRSGGEDFTVQNVASEAGVSRRALYRMFGGRDALVVALLEESHQVFARLLRERADRFADPVDRIGAALYFASDQRQLTDRRYNAALTRAALDASLRVPDAIARAYRPVVDVFTALARDALAGGRIRPGDPRGYGRMLGLALVSYQRATVTIVERMAPRAAQDEFIHFCAAGIGALVPPTWTDRFQLTDAQARLVSERTSEVSESIRQAPSLRGRSSASELIADAPNGTATGAVTGAVNAMHGLEESESR